METKEIQNILDLIQDKKDDIIKICLQASQDAQKKETIKKIVSNLSDEQIDKLINYFSSKVTLSDDDLEKIVGGKYKDYMRKKKNSFFGNLISKLLHMFNLLPNNKNNNNVLLK